MPESARSVLAQQPVVRAAASFVKLFVEFPKVTKMRFVPPIRGAAPWTELVLRLSWLGLGLQGLVASFRLKFGQHQLKTYQQ